MSYHKFTIISGYDVDFDNPYGARALGRAPTGEEAMQCCAWQDAHHKSVALTGHWKPASAWAYAQRRGWSNVEMVHCVSDMSGKGRGGRTAYTFTEAGEAVCLVDENIDDSAEVHALYDEAEGRL